MQKRNLNKKTFDQIGRKLFESSAIPSHQVDRIVSNLHLFDMVQARIAADTASQLNTQPTRSIFLYLRQNVFIFATVVVLIVSAFGAVILFRQEKDLRAVTINEVKIPDAVPDAARPEVPPQPFVGKLSAGRASKANFRVENAAAIKLRPKIKREITAREVNFYPVGYTGDPDETSVGGRIIRVDMDRSSLFALGVNLPLENEDETVKTDLLVGSDGVTRALRIVN